MNLYYIIDYNKGVAVVYANSKEEAYNKLITLDSNITLSTVYEMDQGYTALYVCNDGNVYDMRPKQ